MRRSQDLPVDRPRRRVTGRGILIALGGLFLFVLIFGRAIARFYIDFLWHDALGRDDRRALSAPLQRSPRQA